MLQKLNPFKWTIDAQENIAVCILSLSSAGLLLAVCDPSENSVPFVLSFFLCLAVFLHLFLVMQWLECFRLNTLRRSENSKNAFDDLLTEIESTCSLLEEAHRHKKLSIELWKHIPPSRRPQVLQQVRSTVLSY